MARSRDPGSELKLAETLIPLLFGRVNTISTANNVDILDGKGVEEVPY